EIVLMPSLRQTRKRIFPYRRTRSFTRFSVRQISSFPMGSEWYWRPEYFTTQFLNGSPARNLSLTFAVWPRKSATGYLSTGQAKRPTGDRRRYWLRGIPGL